jgi:hypothetical protein
MKKFCTFVIAFVTAFLASPASGKAADPWLVFHGTSGPGKGKHIVLISGDEEYRSEEGLPQLAKILAKRHGFTCTVLFAIDPKDGRIDPNNPHNIPGLEALKNADLMIIQTRFRDLPDSQMKYIVDYVESGRPVIGLRTATHAFALSQGSYRRYSWDSREWDGGFGRQVLGETWVAHHGLNGRTSTRGVLAPSARNHPILRGVKVDEIWGPTGVYRVRLPMRKGCRPLVLGQVLDSASPTAKPAKGKLNDPMMPVAWTNHYTGRSGKTARTFATTMGASQDLLNENLRRLLVNACYWTMHMKVPAKSDVHLVGDYKPTPFGFRKHAKTVRPAELAKE